MEYSEENYLMISGIQHFEFCRRQWAIIHIEQQWNDNLKTVEGEIMHKRAHDDNFTEKRKNVIISRGMPVHSNTMGVNGFCDIVEFIQDDKNGIEIIGRPGKYIIEPVEYKRGEPKEGNEDVLQVIAEAMCLEEMLLCKINKAYIYYGQTRHRIEVPVTDELRKKVNQVFKEMHQYYERRYTPKVKVNKSCRACSIKELCLPNLCKNKSASDYINKKIEEI